MENRNDLLKKLGFSENYLELLDSENHPLFFEASPQEFLETIVQTSELTSLIIDKTEKPINGHFIYNEK